MGLTRRALLGASPLIVLAGEQARALAQATPIPTSDDDAGGVPVSVLIQNSGTALDRLTGATSPVAREITLHSTHLEQGQRVMRPVGEIVIPAKSVMSLEPGASHLMMEGLQTSLVQGQVFPLSFHFEVAGEVLVDVRVRRKQDAAGVPQTSPVIAGPLTILHASAPPAPVIHD
jgi:periplasmic copper chaperone A